METLRHICAKTEAAFQEFYSGIVIGKLEEVANSWVEGSIIGFKIIPGNKLLVVTEVNDPMSGMMSPKYLNNVYRFFPGGKDGWHCSVDLQDASVEKLTEFFLNKIDERK